MPLVPPAVIKEILAHHHRTNTATEVVSQHNTMSAGGMRAVATAARATVRKVVH